MKVTDVVPVLSGQIACQVDLGDGRQFDVEFSGDGELWVSVGPGIETVSLWAKALGSGIDLRIKVTRTQVGIDITVDRGQQDGVWWPPEACPQLVVATDSNQNSVSVSARIGGGADGRAALLGTISLEEA